MMTMFKTILSRVAIVLLILLWPALIAYAEVTENGLIYTISEDEVKITGYTGSEQVLTIPAEIDGLPVVEVVLTYYDGEQWTSNSITQKVILPETVKVLGSYSFYQFYALTKIEGLEHVQVLGGRNFDETKVTELIFSEKLQRIGTFAIASCYNLKRIRIPDDVVLDADFSFVNFQRYNFALEKIELIKTGNTPTLALDGPMLYTADMKTLIAHPAGNALCSYRIPEGVEELACFAFSLNGGYETAGLQDIVIPRSMNKVYTNTFFSPNNGEMVMPYMHVYSDSLLCGYAQSMGYLYRLRDEGTVTVSDKIQQIVTSVTTSSMTDYEKAYRLNRWLVENCIYDVSLSNHTAFYLLMNGKGVCQSYMLTYEMLLNQVGIPNRQYIVWVDGGHGFNAVYLDGEWCYVDTTWNAPQHDLYFGMNADLVAEYYGIGNSFDQQANNNNTGYKNYALYRQGAYTELFRQASEYLQLLLNQGEKWISITADLIYDQFAHCLTNTSGNVNVDMALLAAYWRDFDFAGCDSLSISFDTLNKIITIHNGEGPIDYSYSLYGDGICINAYTGSDSHVSIPAVIDGLPVLAIGNAAFMSNLGLVEVVIPENVIEIGLRAFQGCASLTNVSLPSSLKEIKDAAFADCIALETITLPDGLTCIGHQVFHSCTGLTSIALPDSLESIGEGIFYACSSLVDVKLPATLNSITAFMFGRCDALRELVIPESVTAIGMNAFGDCRFTTIELPSKLTYIDQYAFLNSSIEVITLPSSMKEIGFGAFNGTQLKSIVFNEGLEVIGAEAFYNSKLESISLPASVTKLGAGCFEACPKLSAVYVAEDSSHFTVHGGILYTKDMRQLICSPVTTSGVVRIPASVSEIGRGAFFSNTLVTEIVFEGALTSLGESAFSDCSALKTISIPSGVKTIPYSCFIRCASLSNLTLPDTLTTIEMWAFEICTSLMRIDLPDTVTSIGENAFGSTGITSLRIPKSMTSLPDNLFANTRINTLYVHPEVTYIGMNNLPDTPGVVYGTSGTYAQEYANAYGYTFISEEEQLSNGNKLVLPDALQMIEAEAFMNTQADIVVIPNGCTSIGERAFASCDNLRYVYMPSSVTFIGAGAFDTIVIFIITEDNYAAQWAAEHNVRIKYQNSGS